MVGLKLSMMMSGGVERYFIARLLQLVEINFIYR
jgi:hypothetical protein